MAWPVERSDGFVVNAVAWNEVVQRLSTWGGDTDAATFNLTNVSSVRGNGSTNVLSFYTNNLERLRIDQFGSVGVNCSPAFIFQVKAGTDQNVGVIPGVTVPNAVCLTAVNDANSAIVPLEFRPLSTMFATGQVSMLAEVGAGSLAITNVALRTHAADTAVLMTHTTASKACSLNFNVGGGNTVEGGLSIQRRTTSNGFEAVLMYLDIGTGFLGLGLNSAAYQLQLATDSAAKPTSNTWTIASDYRTKKNIQPFTDGLATLRQLSPVSYELNGKANLPDGSKGISIIAQDVLDVLPDCISTWKAKLNPEDDEETDLYSFNSSNLTWRLVNAIKELADRVETLESNL